MTAAHGSCKDKRRNDQRKRAVYAVTELMHFIFLEFKEDEGKKAVTAQRQQITNATLIFVALQLQAQQIPQLANATPPITVNMHTGSVTCRICLHV